MYGAPARVNSTTRAGRAGVRPGDGVDRAVRQQRDVEFRRLLAPAVEPQAGADLRREFHEAAAAPCRSPSQCTGDRSACRVPALFLAGNPKPPYVGPRAAVGGCGHGADRGPRRSSLTSTSGKFLDRGRMGRMGRRAGSRYPKCPVPRDENAAKALNKRMLTNLYNARPQWLADAHAALDAAVAAAYAWPADISADDVLRELLAGNGGGA